MVGPVLLLAVVATTSPQALTSGTVAPQAVCRSIGLDPVRIWRVQQVAGRWQLAHWRGRIDEAATVRVTLPPNAEVRLSPTVVALRGKTSNGGIDVTLSGTPAAATLDAYVSYELEVNVDASLTPAIEEIATEGPVGVRCEVAQD